MLPLRLGHEKRLRLLCLGAHADDIEIGCGGTVLRLVEEVKQLSVRWVVFSGNEARHEEAREAAATFLDGVAETTIDTHGFRDGYFPFVGAEIKDVFERLKHETQPDLILTPWRDNAHQDHRTIPDLTKQT